MEKDRHSTHLDDSESQRIVTNGEGSSFGRRELFKGILLCAAGVAIEELMLPAFAKPTEASGELGDYASYGASIKVQPKRDTAKPSAPATATLTITEDNILGPFYRPGAPFRAKITPPFEKGKVVVVAGRVWSFATKKPIANATIDIWQANASGRYDNDDAAHPPKPGVFLNRSRVITDETGYYEFESIHPGRYQIGQDLWRPSHIHYMVQAAGHKSLVTQLYFDGDPYNTKDQFIKKSLIVKFAEKKIGDQSAEIGNFNIVLAAK